MHLLSTRQIESSEQLDSLFNVANSIRCSNLAKNKFLGIVKDEASTRTRISFEVAMKSLGGEVILLDLDNSSSIFKGETVEDTIMTMAENVDVIVMRHSQKGMIHHCSKFSSVPIISGGESDTEHPTQGLLDAYTIYKETGRLDNLNIMMVGDLKCSRTIHSLLYLLSLHKHNIIYLISPEDMKLPEEYFFNDLHFIHNSDFLESLTNIGKKLDILYMTRLQKERYSENLDNNPYYCLGEKESQYLGEACSVLHPLPRNKEISTNFDKDPRAAYFKRQIKNGKYIRMALLGNLFTKGTFLN